MIRAVIDVGSNSVLLTVAGKIGEVWQPIFESSKVTALGAGTKETGLLAERGMSETLAAVKTAFSDASSHGAQRIVAAATMAARIAKNADDFLSRADAQGTPIQILSGEDEARLGFLSVARDPLFSKFPRFSIIDVGGQSTEMAVAERADTGECKELFRKSFPIGTLALLGGSLKEECPDGLALVRASKEIDDVFGSSATPDDAGQAITLGATGTNLVSIRERYSRWIPERVHGARLGFEEVSGFVASLSTMTIEQRSKLVGIEPGREATLPAGALILERALQKLHAEECLVSVNGWRHALLWEMSDYSSTREK